MLKLIFLIFLFSLNANTIFTHEEIPNDFGDYGSGDHPHRAILDHQLNFEPDTAFKNWHYLHEKDYNIDSDEGSKRFQNFKENFELIKQHNNNKNNKFKLGLNHFADFTLEEFHEKFSNINPEHFKKAENLKNKNSQENQYIPPSIKNPEGPLEENSSEQMKKTKEFYELYWNTPDNMGEKAILEKLRLNKNNQEQNTESLRFLEDNSYFTYEINNNKFTLNKDIKWNKKALLEKMISNQGKCGSCWAFSAVQAIEAAYAVKTGKYQTFSKQQLVDCDPISNGCNGGLPHTGFEFFKDNGILTEKEYPYKKGLTVKYKKNCELNDLKKKGIKSDFKVKDYELCFQDTDCHTDSKMFEMLERGPLSACVDASKEFMLYQSGIYDRPCKTKNHAILVTGYHKSVKEGEDSYWLVKNSWGFFWGDIGFIKIKQGSDYNSCLLNDYYTRPILG